MDIQFPKFGKKYHCYQSEIDYIQKVLYYTTLKDVTDKFSLIRYEINQNFIEDIENNKKKIKVSVLKPKVPCELVQAVFETEANIIEKLLIRFTQSIENDDLYANEFKLDLKRMVSLVLRPSLDKMTPSQILRLKHITLMDITKLQYQFANVVKAESLVYTALTDECVLQNIKYPFYAKWETTRISQAYELESTISNGIIDESNRYYMLSERESIFNHQLESTQYLIGKYDRAIILRMRLYNEKMEEMEFHTTQRKTALNDVRNSMQYHQKTYKERERYIDLYFKELFGIKIQRWWKPIYKKIKRRRLRQQKKMANTDDESDILSTLLL